jgi:hypothetical protein
MSYKTANEMACTLYHKIGHDCQRLKRIQTEKAKLYESYCRYRNLLREEEELRARIITSFGVLGKYAPTISGTTSSLISAKPLNSDEIRRDMKIWEMLQVSLSAKDGKLTPSDFQSFLSLMEIEATAQAIDSAIRVHPEIFQVDSQEGGKLVGLRNTL